MGIFQPIGVAFVVVTTMVACRPSPDTLGRIRVNDDPRLKATGPRLLADHLHNPMSPRLAGRKLVLAESGTGIVGSVEHGKLVPLIRGFIKDQFAGYDISAQGITIDPSSGRWIIAAAEGPGRVLLFDPVTFPTDARRGRDIPLVGAVDDNPFSTALAANGRMLVVSGGTKTAYQGDFVLDPALNPAPVRPAFTVQTGLIGVAIDRRSGDVFGAVFGAGRKTGSIIRWDATKVPVMPRIVASGLRSPVDVAFTPSGVLLALEIGTLGTKGDGAVSIVSTDGSGLVTPFITGLNNPSGFSIAPDNTLYITEFGGRVNSRNGTLISLSLSGGGRNGKP